MIKILIIALVLILVIFIYKESSGYNIVEYRLFTDKDIDTPVRFVMISDLHDTDVSHDGNEKLYRSIDSLAPDFVILAGDMVNSYMTRNFDTDVAFALLRRLAAKYRVYYGLGNHEQRFKEEPDRFPGMYDELTCNISSSGMTLLSDSFCDDTGTGIRIYGFDIPIEQYKRVGAGDLPKNRLESVFGSIDDKRFNILIAHNPVFFDDYVRFAPDLVLAGHLHGGVIALPGLGGVISPQLKFFPKYDYGRFDSQDTTMIVSRGIGWHTIPIRIFNKAEIVSVIIEKRDSNTGGQDGNQCET